MIAKVSPLIPESRILSLAITSDAVLVLSEIASFYVIGYADDGFPLTVSVLPDPSYSDALDAFADIAFAFYLDDPIYA